ncbi:putative NADP-dependent oxidoreductase domain-containing protein [Seiridium unicorne]|uniref:NADP-dependent oxidoreductase domain-containing protein n=1 Tax=Seiridium unicorne TaxID=138068 RepID=A0ABR2VBB5_9PEZI
MATKTISDVLSLRNSLKIPQLGFGVYKSPPEICMQSCLTALQAGYRHIDTAQFYANEAQVGEALKKSGITRKDVFLTTKILTAAGSVEQSYRQCLESVEKLDSAEGYVDLFLIHSPNSGSAKRKEMWQALERLHREGKAKSIGVSNFGIQHIEELRQFAEVWPPVVNQIELHPFCQQKEIVQYCSEHKIAVEAYCPIVRNRKSEDPTVKGIAEKHGVTPSQVLIRWSLQRGFIPLPKSDTADRIKANADVFGFDIEDTDLSTLNNLDQGRAGAIVQPVDN